MDDAGMDDAGMDDAGMDDRVRFDKDEPDEPVRREAWPARGPAELELTIDLGRITVRLEEQDTGSDADGEVRVEVRHDPSAAGSWGRGLTGLLSWIGGATGGAVPGGIGPDELAAAAVRRAEVTWSEPAHRLVVRSSEELPLRAVPLAVTVTAPAGSRVAARTGSGDVQVTGRSGWAAARTGSGRITLAGVDGDVDVTTGSGDIEIGSIRGRARVRTGSGGVRIAASGGPTEIKASSGDVTVGAVAADLDVRTGSGDVAIADATGGRLDLTTGSGGLRIGVHPGVRAELDLTSGSGRARSDLDVGAVAPEHSPALHVRGRTGSGDVLVTRAAVPA